MIKDSRGEYAHTRDPRIPVNEPSRYPGMTHLLEQTLEQLTIENEEDNPNNYSDSNSSEASYDSESEEEIVFRRDDSYYLNLLNDNDSYMSDSESQSSTDGSGPMDVDDRVVLHPVHSRYAQQFPSYNVFCGQPLVNNGYINVQNALEAAFTRPNPFLET